MLDTDDRIQRALELACRYLDRRDRTEAEVRAHLQRKGLDADAVEASIEALRDQGYLDDARFARALAHDKRTLEEWGSQRIKRTLLARRVDPDLIEAVLAEEAHGGELDRALALLRRRFPSPVRDPRGRARALGVLIRKGFDSELALDALSEHARSTSEPTLR